MKPQKYNWPLLVRDTMDSAFMPQACMADKLNVSQPQFTFWKTQGESLTPNIRFPENSSGISISQLRGKFAPKWRYCAGIQAQYKTPLLCPRKIQNHVRSDRIWRDQVMEISRISGLTCRLVGGLPFAMLNEQMLKDGFGCLLTIPPNVKYVENFRKTASVLRN